MTVVFLILPFDRSDKSSEHFFVAEALESLRVANRFDRWKRVWIFAQQDRLHAPLTLLVEVPLLKEVDYGHVIDDIAAHEAVLARHEFANVHYFTVLNLASFLD